MTEEQMVEALRMYLSDLNDTVAGLVSMGYEVEVLPIGLTIDPCGAKRTPVTLRLRKKWEKVL